MCQGAGVDFGGNIQADDGFELITLAGEMDLRTAPELRAALAERMERGDCVAVDLTALTFMDSSGIAALVAAQAASARTGARLLLVGLPPQSSHVMELAGVLTSFQTVESVPAAREFFSLGH